MPPLADDCFAHDGGALTVDAARAILDARLAPVTGTETVGLRGAAGRVLAEAVIAGRDVPPHDNAAVDGYAVWFADLATAGETRLPVAGRIAAGHPLAMPARRGAALRIFTGAPMPGGEEGGPDTVVMQEDVHLADGAVVLPPGVAQGANRRRRGEDIARGATVLAAGKRLRPPDIGLAASLGWTELTVHARLRVAVLSSGDEVAEPGSEVGPGQVYDANRHGLMALLDGLGCAVVDHGIVPDRREDVEAALAWAAAGADVVIASAGMSSGEEDHMTAALARLGHLHFWRLAVKPGRPVALGQIGAVPFIGLPGNPAAMMVAFLTLARPAILRLAGAGTTRPHTFPVRAGFDFTKKPGRREYVVARLTHDAPGTPTAMRVARSGAGILSALAAADGLVDLAEETTSVVAGDAVVFLPLSEVLG